MFLSIPHPHYFSHKSSKEIKEIYLMTLINGIAMSIALIFEPIYLYHIGFGFKTIMWFYVQVYCWYSVLMLFGSMFASRFGLKKSILFGNLVYPMYWLVLFMIPGHAMFFVLAPFLFALQKSLFWPAFNTLSAISSAKDQRGRQVGVIMTLLELSYIAGPLIGGFISQAAGFDALFVFASVLVVLSCIPLFMTREVHVTGSFSIRKLLRLTSINKRNFFGYWGYAEDLMLMSLWPVFTFIVVKQFLGVGLINTFATLVASVLMLYIGRASDRNDKQELVEATSFFYGVTWLFRFVAVDTISVIIFDVLTKIGKGLVNVPLVSLTFETARIGGKEFSLLYTTFYEFALSIGKIFTALASIVILSFTQNIYIVFALVGVMTFLYSLVTKKIRI